MKRLTDYTSIERQANAGGLEVPILSLQEPDSVDVQNESIRISNTTLIECKQFIPHFPSTHTLFYIPGSACNAHFPKPTDAECKHLAKELNFKVITIYHRLSPQNQYPIPLNDICSVIDHYFQRSEEYQIDRNKVAIGGYSSGALFALMICRACLHHKSIPFQQILLFAPVTNLNEANPRPYGVEQPSGVDLQQREAPFVTKEFFRSIVSSFVPEKFDPASPLFSLACDDPKAFLHCPPVIIVHGENECFNEDTKRFVVLLKQAKIRHSVLTIAGKNHTFPWHSTEHLRDVSKIVHDYFRLPVEQNHYFSRVCQLPRFEENSFFTLLKWLFSLMINLYHLIISLLPLPKKPIPTRMMYFIERNPNYVPRRALTNDLHKKLEAVPTKNETVAVVACHGIGGVGKTELVIHYAHEKYGRNWFWFVAENEASFVDKMRHFLKWQSTIQRNALTTTKEVEDAFNQWREENPDKLCIFDNVYSNDIVKAWCRSSSERKAKILLTTRNPVFDGDIVSTVLVDPMQYDEALRLLEKFSGRPVCAYQEDESCCLTYQSAGLDELSSNSPHGFSTYYIARKGHDHLYYASQGKPVESLPILYEKFEDVLDEIPRDQLLSPNELKKILDLTRTIDASKIIKELSFLPLVIESAGRYIKKHNYSYREFFIFYQNHKNEFAAFRGSENHPSSIPMMIALYWRHFDENTKQLLRFIACMAANRIPRFFLKNIFKTIDEVEFNQSLAELLECGLIQADGDDYYKIHRLYQDSLFIRYIEESVRIRFIQNIIDEIERIAKKLDKTDDELIYAAGSLLPHIQHLIGLNLIINLPGSMVRDLTRLYCVFNEYYIRHIDMQIDDLGNMDKMITIGISAMEFGGQVGFFIAKAIVDHLEKTTCDESNAPFSVQSYRGNHHIKFLKFSADHAEQYRKTIKKSLSLAQKIVHENEAVFNPRQITLLDLYSAISCPRNDREACLVIEESIDKLMSEHGFLPTSELVIFGCIHLGNMYRYLAKNIHQINERVELLISAILLLQHAISGLEQHTVKRDYLIYSEAQLELAACYKDLAVDLFFLASNTPSDKPTACMKHAEILYRHHIGSFVAQLGEIHDTTLRYQRESAPIKISSCRSQREKQRCEEGSDSQYLQMKIPIAADFSRFRQMLFFKQQSRCNMSSSAMGDVLERDTLRKK